MSDAYTNLYDDPVNNGGAVMPDRICQTCGTGFRARTRQFICDGCQTPCSTEGCTRPARRKGLCFGHLNGTFTPQPTGICSVEGCEKKTNHMGLCSMHAYRKRKYGYVGVATATRNPRGAACSVDGCEKLAVSQGYCGMHWERVKTHGHPGTAGRIRAVFGSGSVNRDGYRIIRIDGDAVFEHRHIMSQELGRDLLPDENVHHKDGDRAHNDPDNLELWNTQQPPGQRVTDKVHWALALLKRYPEFAASEGYRLLPLESHEATQVLGTPSYRDFDPREVLSRFTGG